MNEIKGTSTNKKAFKKLIKIYANVTIEDIEEIENSITYLLEEIMFEGSYGDVVASYLTGYGTTSCLLCVDTLCSKCYWETETDKRCSKHKTYEDIGKAKDKYELKKAMNARSVYMNKFI